MRKSFAQGFRTWLEASIAKDAVLGVVSGGREISDGEEKDHLMSRNTRDFSSEIRRKLKQLGVVKSIGDMETKASLMRSIDDGIVVADLIKKIGPEDIREDSYESEVESMGRHADVRNSMALQEPEYIENRDSFVKKMMERGLSRDEAEKRADAEFGPEVRDRRTP